MQIIGGTGVGGPGSEAYARAQGIEPEAFLARFWSAPYTTAMHRRRNASALSGA